MGEKSDGELMREVQEGDVAQLGVLFERHHVRLFNYFLRFTGSRQASEDMVQDTFLRMLHYRDTYRGDGSFPAWMFRMGRNLAVDHFRKHSREVAADTEADQLPAGGPLPLAELEEEESVSLLRAALLRLPADKREVLILSRYELLKYDEIAELLGCTVGAIKLRVHRAIKDLRTLYRQLASEATS